VKTPFVLYTTNTILFFECKRVIFSQKS
jgi:hypothetical protein